MKILFFTGIALVVLLAFLTDVDFAIEALLLVSIIIISLLPIVAAFMLFLALVFSLLDKMMNAFYDKVTEDKELANTIASHMYFVKDMGPSVSSVSIVAFFVTTDATRWDLIFMFFTGVVMKYIARKFIHIYYRNIELRKKRKEEGRNDNGCNS